MTTNLTSNWPDNPGTEQAATDTVVGGAANRQVGLDDPDAFFEPGRNCWQVAHADRIGFITESSEYFRLFAQACRQARRQILILGWDFDRKEPLFRDQGPEDLPWQLGEYLTALVQHRRELQLYLLSWDFNMIYAAERELAPAFRLRLQAPARFHFKLDGQHPIGASHHQKVVVVDDRIAFVGGIDLSRWRWDTREHRPNDPRRIDPNGEPYPPFHDMMMLVEGEAAACLGELARTRWRRAHGRRLQPPELATATPSPWPEDAPVHVRDLPVAIARTEPRYDGRAAVFEIRNLYQDAIHAARGLIYIENQYFTDRGLTAALATRLAEDDGPDVVLVLPRKTGGWLEQATMDVLRYRVVDKLRRADRHGRLRIYYPHQPGLGEDCISVHAKLLIVDDRLLRIGSSNASSRSMGLDTECDLAVAAAGEDDATAQAIRQLRHDLLAEHLDVTATRVAEAETRAGGMIGAIESLRTESGRSLRELEPTCDQTADELLPDSGIVDPPEPLNADYFVEEYIPRRDRPQGRQRLLGFVALIVALLALAAAWRWTPLNEWLSPERIRGLLSTFHDDPVTRAAVAVTGFIVASILMVPLTLLAVFGGMIFGGAWGFVYVASSALLSAALAFGMGRFLNRNAVQRLSGGRLERLSRRLSDRGVLAVAVLRLIPVAPFTVFNLVAGASSLKFRHYMIGSLIGLIPGIGALTLFSGNLWSALKNPSWKSLLITAAFAAVILVSVLLMRRWLRSR